MNVRPPWRSRSRADGHVDVVRASASPVACNHRRRQLDPVNANAPPAERNAMRPVPTPSSSAPALPARRGNPPPGRRPRARTGRATDPRTASQSARRRSSALCTIAGAQRRPPLNSVACDTASEFCTRSGMGLDLGSVEFYAGLSWLGGPDGCVRSSAAPRSDCSSRCKSWTHARSPRRSSRRWQRCAPAHPRR